MTLVEATTALALFDAIWVGAILAVIYWLSTLGE